jgi:host cell factor
MSLHFDCFLFLRMMILKNLFSLRYLNDLYVLENINNDLYWSCPQTFGQGPSPRESHTCVAFKNKDGSNPRLFIYGGMSGVRLGDLWILCVDNMTWIKPNVSGVIPLPRSLHTATVIKHRMFIFGGWVPLTPEADLNKSVGNTNEWKCSNTLGCLNMENLCWEPLALELFEDNTPRARAGHSACEINNRLYVWSGRDGYRKAWNNQVCCKDMWFLETDVPLIPGKVQLLKPTTNSLEVTWTGVPTADAYLLQIQKVEATPLPELPEASTSASPMNVNLERKMSTNEEDNKKQQQPNVLVNNINTSSNQTSNNKKDFLINFSNILNILLFFF